MSAIDEANNDTTKSKSPKRGLFGCALSLLSIGLPLLVLGIYMLSRWSDLTTGLMKALAIVFVVLGTISIAPLLIAIVALIALRIFIKKAARDISTAVKDMSAVGGQLFGKQKTLYESVHEYRSATSEDFATVEKADYVRVATAFFARGFQELGDVVNTTIEKSHGLTLPIRTLASSDGTTHVGIYAFPVPGQSTDSRGARPMMIDIETEFSDGTFVTTGNNERENLTTSPPGIRSTRMPINTAVEELLRSHEASKRQYMSEQAEVTCLQCLTLSDVMDSQKRQSAIKSDFRKKIGFIDPEEVRRVAKQKSGLDDDAADAAARAADTARRKYMKRDDQADSQPTEET